MTTSKGHIQPHHTNLPRRRPRTRSPPGPSSLDNKPSTSLQPKSHVVRPSAPRSRHESTNSTRSTASSASDQGDRPSPRRRRGASTPLTSPSDAVLADDALPDKFPTPAAQPPAAIDAAQDLGTPLGFHPPRNVFSNAAQPRFTAGGARGHLEPHVTNLPRRLSRAHKEREGIRRRCLQEFITGSGVWIAFSAEFGSGDHDDDEPINGLIEEEKKDRDWMWEERLGFTGVIRVLLCRSHGECQKEVKGQEGEEELELTIGREQVKAYEDVGISVLTDSQLENAAAFLIESCRRRGGNGKVLISVPPSRPVEALSIALFALSLPSTSSLSSSPLPHPSPSYLSQLRFLPGILELEQSQEIDIDVAFDDSESTEFAGVKRHPKYTLIQLALWHIHDLPPAHPDEEHGGLKPEWRGALSLNGIENLESLVASLMNPVAPCSVSDAADK